MILLQINADFLDKQLWGESVGNYLLAAGIVGGALLLKKPLANLLCRAGYKLASRFTNEANGQLFRQQIQRPVEMLISTLLIFVAFQQLHDLLEQFVVQRAKEKNSALAIRFGDVIDHIFLLFTIAFSTWTVSRIIDYIYHIQREDALRDGDRSRQQLLPLVKEIIKLLLWTTAFFWVLGAVFHVNIPAIITGLGIGGVAIALAAKETVENLFAAFTMLSDKPFETGDVIRIGTLEGTVERIGFRSTRIRHADGSAYIVPNRKLVSENIENLTNRNSRRVRLSVQIKYGIAPEKLKKLLQEIKETVQKNQYINDVVKVTVDSFAENVFLLLVTYHLPHPLSGSTPDAVKQDVNFDVYRLLTQYTAPDAISVGEAPPEAPEEDPDEEQGELGIGN